MNFAWLIASLAQTQNKVRATHRQGGTGFSLWVLLLCAIVYAQPPQQKSRDLKYEEDRPAAASVTIPRGYALVVGIAKYKNLPAKAQLDFAERDAESVYSVLINPEGGNFRAENVHRLVGAQAPRGHGPRAVAYRASRFHRPGAEPAPQRDLLVQPVRLVAPGPAGGVGRDDQRRILGLQGAGSMNGGSRRRRSRGAPACLTPRCIRTITST